MTSHHSARAQPSPSCANRVALVAAAFLCGIAFAFPALAITCLPYYGQLHTENFNTLATTGTSSAIPTGFGFAEGGFSTTGGGTADANYMASDGTHAGGDTFSFGTPTDRALGEITESTFDSRIGFCAINATPYPIPVVAVGYTGEKWRNGSQTTDRLDFQYSLSAMSLDAPDWTAVPSLDFVISAAGQPVGPTDGNAALHRQVLPLTWITLPAAWAPGATLWIRWRPSQAGGVDLGMAIDDFVFQTRECRLDVDGNGQIDALTDGLMILRAMFGLTGAAVTNSAVGANAQRRDWTTVRGYLNGSCGASFGQ
jgi:hypothetical protein